MVRHGGGGEGVPGEDGSAAGMCVCVLVHVLYSRVTGAAVLASVCPTSVLLLHPTMMLMPIGCDCRARRVNP